MSHRMYLIGYDINNNGNRCRALKLLRANSAGYQDSVFEVQSSPKQLSELMEKLKHLLDLGQDRLFCTELKSSSACWQLGTGEMSPTGDLLIIM
jgi:CRISPR-associated endonuclease Cas2